MKINEEKNLMQDEAVNYWVLNNFRGTIKLPTGSGKNFIFLKALHLTPKKSGKINLFLSESNTREHVVKKEIEEFDKIFNTKTLEDYVLHFKCYQSAKNIYDAKYSLVCCDEIHDQMTPNYCEFFLNNNHYEYLIGLTAGIKDINYGLSDKSIELFKKNKIKFKNHFIVSKQELIDEFCPICYSRDNKEFSEIGFSRKLNIYVIKNKLDNCLKDYNGTWDPKTKMTEEVAYKSLTANIDYLQKKEPEKDEDLQVFAKKQNARILKYVQKRRKMLYNLKSKNEIIFSLKRFLKNKGKTIIYGESIDALSKFTMNCVSSKNKDIVNNEILNNFENNLINFIASAKKIKQGSNLKDLDNVIIHSYNSSFSDFDQRIGRLRVRENKIGNVFVIVTLNTKEVDYFNAMIKNQKHNNFILCESYLDCISKYINNQKQQNG